MSKPKHEQVHPCPFTEAEESQSKEDTVECSEVRAIKQELIQVNSNFKMLLNPVDGLLIVQKMEIDRLKSFQRIVVGVLLSLAIPVLGIIGVTGWKSLTKNSVEQQQPVSR